MGLLSKRQGLLQGRGAGLNRVELLLKRQDLLQGRGAGVRGVA